MYPPIIVASPTAEFLRGAFWYVVVFAVGIAFGVRLARRKQQQDDDVLEGGIHPATGQQHQADLPQASEASALGLGFGGLSEEFGHRMRKLRTRVRGGVEELAALAKPSGASPRAARDVNMRRPNPKLRVPVVDPDDILDDDAQDARTAADAPQLSDDNNADTDNENRAAGASLEIAISGSTTASFAARAPPAAFLVNAMEDEETPRHKDDDVWWAALDASSGRAVSLNVDATLTSTQRAPTSPQTARASQEQAHHDLTASPCGKITDGTMEEADGSPQLDTRIDAEGEGDGELQLRGYSVGAIRPHRTCSPGGTAPISIKEFDE